MNKIAYFIGEVARPLTILFTGISASVAGVLTAVKVEDGADAALLMAAIYGGVGVLYGAKALESWKNHRADADVKIAENTNGNES